MSNRVWRRRRNRMWIHGSDGWRVRGRREWPAPTRFRDVSNHRFERILAEEMKRLRPILERMDSR